MVSSFFWVRPDENTRTDEGKCLFVRAFNLNFFNIIRTKWELTVFNENT